jgi:hypothetical protein
MLLESKMLFDIQKIKYYKCLNIFKILILIVPKFAIPIENPNAIENSLFEHIRAMHGTNTTAISP